ncbi:immunoglobulin lambda-1 light chain-like [Protopterus annectens]|uniref:immunoglobulin lambda-1 light chain-like n=1 Tax=Protopterus annectens TaxID=7888 RepID=UPI001CFBC293|nr:immunoglobulin lambda-1 light chain-like [Protopterus annectens]
MFWVVVITMITAYWDSCMAQLSLSQPPTESVSLGQTTKLPCTMSGGSISSYYMSWYQQRPGTAPRLLIYRTTSRQSGIPDRFSGSEDSSSNTVHLTITGVQAENDADYYCAAGTHNTYAYIFGGGTKLAVQTSSPKAPAVSLLPPSADELATKQTVTLSCLLHGFFPRTATVTWKGDTTVLSTGVQNSEVKADGASDYKMSSYLTLSAADWKSHDSFTCLVSHESKTITQSITKSECLQS